MGLIKSAKSEAPNVAGQCFQEKKTGNSMNGIKTSINGIRILTYCNKNFLGILHIHSNSW